ncbi:MAG: Hsp70 family protein [Phycisphaerae bacterium]|nr:Hsp70 family protein [Phycisphaerae bacterium]
MQTPARSVGIDLGTTFSAIAYLDERGEIICVPNRHGDLLTPSVVLYEQGGSVVVGREAKEAAVFEPDRVVECVKRDMGEDHISQPVAGVELTPEQVSAVILRRLAQDYERHVGPIQDVVITVPAYFDDTRRKATIDSGKIAGLSVSAILNEPVAAAMAASLRETLVRAGSNRPDTSAALDQILKPQTTLVYDLGGGTFDVTVVRSDGSNIETIVTAGSARLGGKDWDDRIIKHLIQRFRDEHGLDVLRDPLAMADIRAAAERAKLALTDRLATPIRARAAGKRLTQEMTRKEFEELTADLLAQTQLTTELIIEEADLSWNDIDRVLIVGGSTRMPMISRMLQEVTGRRPDASLQADLAVAQGAAIYAAMHAAGRAKSDASDCETIELPYEGEVLTTLESIEVQHVNSHSLGVVARNRAGEKINSTLIKKNTPIPASKAKVYGLETRGQTSIRVVILEGEAKDPTACTVIGECCVTGLPEGLPRGAPIRITCRYDVDGRIHVEAQEMVSGNTARTQINREHGLTRERVDSLANSMAKIVIG